MPAPTRSASFTVRPAPQRAGSVVGLGLLCLLSLNACSSSPNSGRGGSNMSFGSEPVHVWEQSKAAGAAYAAEAFTYRKMQPIGAKNDYIFYFKQCEETGAASWYSKTSYECTEP